NLRKIQVANVVKKHSISSELAQKMGDAAAAKAREIGVSENVAILDDGGNLKAFGRMDGARAPSIRPKALRLPPSSRIATFSLTPISLAFAAAASPIFC